MCSKQKKAVVFYERNYKTSHMQIQAIPIPEKATRELREIFQVSNFKIFTLKHKCYL